MDWITRVRSPARAKDFYSNLCIQIGSKAHPDSYPMGSRDPFPRRKEWPGHDTNHSPPSSAQVKKEEVFTSSTPPYTITACTRDSFTLLVYHTCMI
jgi:hypothetical protein